MSIIAATRHNAYVSYILFHFRFFFSYTNIIYDTYMYVSDVCDLSPEFLFNFLLFGQHKIKVLFYYILCMNVNNNMIKFLGKHE